MTGSSYSMVPLADFSRVQSGYAFKSADWQPSGIPVVQIGNVRPRTIELDGCKFVTEQVAAQAARFRLRRDDILISMTGHIGVVGRVKLDAHMMLNQRVGRFEHINVRLVDPSYLFQVLQSEDVRHKLVKLGYGAAQPNISPTLIGSVEVPIPPIEIQRRIASVLGVYDDLIEVNRNRVALLEKMARGLFEEWFVRFRFPGHETLPTVETPEGLLPVGWSWQPFSTLAQFVNGFAFKPSDFEKDGLPIVKIPELKNGLSSKTPRNSGQRVPANLKIETGDLLFSWSGTLAISEWTGGPALLNQHLFLVIPRGRVSRAYLREALRAALPKFDGFGVGATMKHIRRSALDAVCVALPSDGELMHRADAALTAFYNQIVILRMQNERLAASRDLLLPRLISGQLSVTQAELELAAAA